ncbi:MULTISPECIES: hypothetical protein [unclassified Rhodococcus (in: high G+C Gram-positive bacteria)]|uniref:hypothetical protein n=1 Tax=unclassified Rhodococcus (in: high G+C Gram-positive bacteria) TaxID=192944 RepID=UPI00307A7C6C
MHSLRAGFVTQAFRNGADAHAIMRQTGHSHRATVEIYARENAPLIGNASPRSASDPDEHRPRDLTGVGATADGRSPVRSRTGWSPSTGATPASIVLSQRTEGAGRIPRRPSDGGCQPAAAGHRDQRHSHRHQAPGARTQRGDPPTPDAARADRIGRVAAVAAERIVRIP